jgi:hypothetical protein
MAMTTKIGDGKSSCRAKFKMTAMIGIAIPHSSFSPRNSSVLSSAVRPDVTSWRSTFLRHFLIFDADGVLDCELVNKRPRDFDQRGFGFRWRVARCPRQGVCTFVSRHQRRDKKVHRESRYEDQHHW